MMLSTTFAPVDAPTPRGSLGPSSDGSSGGCPGTGLVEVVGVLLGGGAPVVVVDGVVVVGGTTGGGVEVGAGFTTTMFSCSNSSPIASATGSTTQRGDEVR